MTVSKLHLLAAAAALAAFATGVPSLAEDSPSVPENSRLVAEVDGCRTWRITDEQASDTGRSYVSVEPKYVYFTKCGGTAVPTTQPTQPN